MAMSAASKDAQKSKILESLPSWIDRAVCTVSPSPPTGKKVNFWTVSFRCSCCSGPGIRPPQVKVYWKKDSTQESLADEMAQKIDAIHGPHNGVAKSASTAGVMSSSEMVHHAISMAQLEQQVRL